MNWRSLAARCVALSMVAAGLAGATACAPRTVYSITGSSDQVKMVWVDWKETGVVQCERASDGNLTNCRDLPIEFQKNK